MHRQIAQERSDDAETEPETNRSNETDHDHTRPSRWHRRTPLAALWRLSPVPWRVAVLRSRHAEVGHQACRSCATRALSLRSAVRPPGRRRQRSRPSSSLDLRNAPRGRVHLADSSGARPDRPSARLEWRVRAFAGVSAAAKTGSPVTYALTAPLASVSRTIGSSLPEVGCFKSR